MSLGVPSVEDDRRLVRDPERAQRYVELGGRAAVPADRVLELIRVEIEGPREVVLLVLLGNPEIDMEEQEGARRCGLRPAAREELREPVGMDEALVVRQALDGKASCRPPTRASHARGRGRLRGPGRPACSGTPRGPLARCRRGRFRGRGRCSSRAVAARLRSRRRSRARLRETRRLQGCDRLETLRRAASRCTRATDGRRRS